MSINVYNIQDLIKFTHDCAAGRRAPDDTYECVRAQLASSLAARGEVIVLLRRALVLAHVEGRRNDLLALLLEHEGDCRCVWSVLCIRVTLGTAERQCPPATHPLCDWVNRSDRLHYLEGDDHFNACIAVAELVL